MSCHWLQSAVPLSPCGSCNSVEGRVNGRAGSSSKHSGTVTASNKIDIALWVCVHSLHLSKMWVWREAGSSEQKSTGKEPGVPAAGTVFSWNCFQLELNFLLCPGGAHQAFLAQQPPFFNLLGYLQVGSYWDRENPTNYKRTLGFHYLLWPVPMCTWTE